MPTWVEVSITLGALAAFMLMYAIFSKLFPIISLWEIKEGQELEKQVAVETEPEGLPSPSFSSP